MTQETYELGHRVFSGGRYLRALDHLSDIDHFEHSILVYIGSLMPFDKGFVRTYAYPSVATISRSTKISESTVRKKLRSLERKGLIETEEVKYFNQRGRFQQSSNNYSLTSSAFDQFELNLQASEKIERNIRGRATDKGPQESSTNLPPLRYVEGPDTSDAPSLCETAPKSPIHNLSSKNPKTTSSSTCENVFSAKQAADRVIAAWEEEFHKPVSTNEQERFHREFSRVRANEVWMLERIMLIASDPYLTSRAKSINFLFSGLDFALKDKCTINQRVNDVLAKTRSEDELKSILVQIPEYVSKHSKGFFAGSSALAYQLVSDPVAETKKRLGLKAGNAALKTRIDLRKAILKFLDEETDPIRIARMNFLLENFEQMNFTQALELFNRHSEEVIHG